MRKALGPTSVVMLLAGSSRDVSMLWESCKDREMQVGQQIFKDFHNLLQKPEYRQATKLQCEWKLLLKHCGLTSTDAKRHCEVTHNKFISTKREAKFNADQTKVLFWKSSQ